MPHQIHGIHAVRGWLKSGQTGHGDTLLIDERRRDKRLGELIRQARQASIQIRRVSKKELDRIAEGEVHQGVVASLQGSGRDPIRDENWLEELLDRVDQPLLLALDGVTDPHSLGACLRSADAAGVDAVIVPRDRSAGMTPVVRKVASGAAESVPFVMVTNLARQLKRLADRGIWIIGAAGEAVDSIYQADFKGGTAIVMGAEGDGMRRLTKEQCSQLVKIPMSGSVSSLNVSVATGVTLFEAVRQRVSRVYSKP